MNGDATTTCMLDITTGHADWNHRNLKCQSNVLHQIIFEPKFNVGPLTHRLWEYEFYKLPNYIVCDVHIVWTDVKRDSSQHAVQLWEY